MLPAHLARLIVAGVAACSGCGRFDFDEVPDAGPGEVLPDPVSATVTRFTTPSPTFAEVPGGALTIPASPGVRWLLVVSAGLQANGFGELDVEARYLVDGVERGFGATQNAAIDRPGPWQHFYVHEGTETPAQVTVELRRGTNSTTSTIDNLHLVAIALPTAADSLYASGDPIRQVVTSGYQTIETFVVDPASPGDYVFLLLANTTDAPLEGDIFTLWRAPDGQPWTQVVQNPRRPWQSNMFVRRATLGADPVSIRFEAESPGGQARNVRLFAFRADGFPSVELAQDATAQQTVNPAVIIVNQLAVTGSSSRFLYLGSSRVQADCSTDIMPADRGNFFIVDGMTEALVHATQNCAYMTTYGTVGLLPAAPSALSIGFNSGNAEVVEYLESSILLVGLD